MTAPLLSVRDIKVQFRVPDPNSWFGTKPLKAVDGVSFDLEPGETLGVVGESGCGKSTLARAILGLVPVHEGTVEFEGKTASGRKGKARHDLLKDMQIIFQDPLASLNPRMTVGSIIAEPLQTHYPRMTRETRKQKVKAVMEKVGLLPDQINRYPHEFSGGQCQRIGIARALILKPKLILCDEPVSALDVSIQAQIVNLLMDIQKEMGLSLVFIAHDLSVVRHISQRVLVMYLGKVMELAPRDDIYDNPLHPYTKALIDAVPIPDPKTERGKVKQVLEGDIPSPIDPPSGCPFRTRCPRADQRCADETPELREIDNHILACHHV